LSSFQIQSWWATSPARAHRTAFAAAGLVAILLGLSCVIWVSPSVQNAISAGVKAVASVDPLVAKNAALKKKADALQQQLWKEEGQMKSLQAASLSHQALSASQMASMQQQLLSTQNSLSAAMKNLSATPSPKNSVSSVSTAVSAPTKAQLLDPTSRYYGLYTTQSPFNYAEVNATSAEVGVQPNLAGYFQGWDADFRSDAVTAAWSHGQLPLLTWESQPSNVPNGVTNQPAYSLSTILSGSFDAYIKRYADSISSTGLPLVLRFDHEMNAVWYPWSEDDGHGNSINGNHTGDYVKVWQHVWNIFQAEGANQYVIWDWSPNIVNNLTAAHQSASYTQSLYPGNQYVDWVGLSGYMRPPFATNQQFTFDYTYTPTLNILRSITSKKILLSEVGASETGGHKPAWITSFFSSLALPQNADVIGFAWFDEAVSSTIDGTLGTNDWRVDSRPDTLSAFIAGLANPADNFVLRPTQ
jgi:mannan endo-1,4-beta-mannosidase